MRLPGRLTKPTVRLSVALLTGVLTGAVVAAGTAHATSNGVLIANAGTHKCLTVQGGSTNGLTPIVQMPCTGAFGQHWIFLGSSGGIRQVYSLDTGQCLLITAFQNFGRVVQDFCGTGDAGLFWSITDFDVPFPQRRILLKSYTMNFCLDLENGLPDDGLPLQVWQCNPNTNNQRWDVTTPPPSVGKTGQILGLAFKCVDVAGGSNNNGTTVQLFTCNGTNAQQWNFPGDNTIHALGKCLDVSGGGTANGTRVQLWDCNGTGAQQWLSTYTSELFNPQSNRCLDVTGGNPQDSTPLQISDCTDAPNQHWTIPT
jgi:Ricin-type beta-trefoil lectin domain